MSGNKICKSEGCEKIMHAKGFCNMHYSRLKRTNDPIVMNNKIHGNSKYLGENKICSRCKTEKLKSEFNKRPERPSGVRSKCKDCEREIRQTTMKDYYKKQSAKYYKENKEIITAKNKEWVKKNPEKVKETSKRCYYKHLDKNRAYGREYGKKNKERFRERNTKSNKAWREKNREHSRAYMKSYKEKRRNTDPNFLAKERINANFRTKMVRKLNKKYDTFFNQTNTSLDEYVDYLKKENPLLWDKYLIDKNIHIDHIIPCNLYDFTIKSEVSKCWDKRNLRLIPASDNIRKKDLLCKELVMQYNIKHLLPEGVTID